MKGIKGMFSSRSPQAVYSSNGTTGRRQRDSPAGGQLVPREGQENVFCISTLSLSNSSYHGPSF